jgi:hypothetical protein
MNFETFAESEKKDRDCFGIGTMGENRHSLHIT